MTSNTEYFNINHFALQELNISQNHFHFPRAIRQPLMSNPAVPGWIICIRKSNKILIKIYVILYRTNTYIFHWGKQQHNLMLIIFLAVFYLIFVCKLFSVGQLQWLLSPMEVGNLQHPTKSSLWRSDDGLIAKKIKAEVYLGSMESKHTTRFTRKKRAKK